MGEGRKVYKLVLVEGLVVDNQPRGSSFKLSIFLNIKD
jgi:hypothetical protein